MRFTALTPQLREVLNLVASATKARPASADGLLGLAATAETVTVRGSNLELEVAVECPAKVDQSGGCLVPAELVRNFIERVLDMEVEVRADAPERGIWISCASFPDVRIDAPADRQLAAFPFEKDRVVAKMHIPAWLSLLESVMFAVGRDDTASVLSGALIVPADGRLTMVATDRYVLARAILDLGPEVQEEGGPVLVPVRVLEEVRRVFRGRSGTVSLSIGNEDRAIGLFSEGVAFTGRLLEGNYPPYDRLIPEAHQTTAATSTTALRNRVDGVALFAAKETDAVTLGVGEGLIKVVAETSGLGENHASVAAVVEGPSASVTLKAHDLLAVLELIDSDRVMLAIGGRDRPVAITGAPQGNALYLAMPLISREP